MNSTKSEQLYKRALTQSRQREARAPSPRLHRYFFFRRSSYTPNFFHIMLRVFRFDSSVGLKFKIVCVGLWVVLFALSCLWCEQFLKSFFQSVKESKKHHASLTRNVEIWRSYEFPGFRLLEQSDISLHVSCAVFAFCSWHLSGPTFETLYRQASFFR